MRASFNLPHSPHLSPGWGWGRGGRGGEGSRIYDSVSDGLQVVGEWVDAEASGMMAQSRERPGLGLGKQEERREGQVYGGGW